MQAPSPKLSPSSWGLDRVSSPKRVFENLYTSGPSRSPSPTEPPSPAPSDNCSNYHGNSECNESPETTTSSWCEDQMPSFNNSYIGHPTWSSSGDGAPAQCCLYHQDQGFPSSFHHGSQWKSSPTLGLNNIFLEGDIMGDSETLNQIEDEDNADRHDSISLARTLVGDSERALRHRDSIEFLHSHIYTIKPPGRPTSNDHQVPVSLDVPLAAVHRVSVGDKKDLDSRKQPMLHDKAKLLWSEAKGEEAQKPGKRNPSGSYGTTVTIVRQDEVSLCHSRFHPTNSQVTRDPQWDRSKAIVPIPGRNRDREQHINTPAPQLSSDTTHRLRAIPEPERQTWPIKVIQHHPPGDVQRSQFLGCPDVVQDYSRNWTEPTARPIAGSSTSFQCPPKLSQQIHHCPVRETRIRRTPVVSNTRHNQPRTVVIQVDAGISHSGVRAAPDTYQ